MWFGPLKRFQKLFFHTPLVNVFILASEVYHDYYRWPLIGGCSALVRDHDGQMFPSIRADGPQGRPLAAASPHETTVPASSRIH